ncbi:methyltransferase domain-containing protein [Colletotrichum musicola]|uniref:Methyltransferase domain-containing protein n=1 Tax=Colletotrichum musicola TaxID=2175873 RepID=A0A8H6IXL7_9PEZI|nr:methyltransferase domain-containing protein [Colletotrichum musicola]
MQQDNAEVLIDVDDDDTQSETGSSIASSRTSLRSSLLDYRVENGRTYHRYKDGKYAIPNDEREQDRLDLTHQLWLLTLHDRLGVAPPCKEGANVGRALDVGPGTGIWALNFGDEHPEAEVRTLHAAHHLLSSVFLNVTFEVDDLEDEWIFSRPFDYIHSRMMSGSIADWRTYLQNCFDNLKPGGYVEVQDIDLFIRSDDGTLKPDGPLMKWTNLLHDATHKLGRPYVEIPSLKQILVDIGFEDVTLDVYKWPTNSWPKDARYKEIGTWSNENMAAGLEAFTMGPVTRAHGWTREEVDVLLVEVRRDINDRRIHAYWPTYCVVGRKPEKQNSSEDP